MARMSLLPGFRFHPTDVELVMYHLKRKVLGKKPHVEAIAEVNIYKFSPWDLPDKSYLKSKDLEWFFFCPREKYASGVRVKRATESGFWKTTGKDRPIKYKDRMVGMVKTLVFHSGHSSQGERTDWVMHEYRIVDDQLTAGVQDLYVLCRVYKKSGLGPKNGAQYGAPFNEADWVEDDFDTSLLPEMQSSVVTGIIDHGTTSSLPQTEAAPSSASGPSSNGRLMNESGDEIVCLLESFTDEHTLPFNKNRNHEDDLIDNGNDTSLNCVDGNAIFDGLGGLDLWASMKDTEFGSDLQTDNMLLQDHLSYIELNDFTVPLNLFAGLGGSEQLTLPDICGSCSQKDPLHVQLSLILVRASPFYPKDPPWNILVQTRYKRFISIVTMDAMLLLVWTSATSIEGVAYITLL